jgi:DNA-binding winged helix-turn-helix (wHTH) protein
MQPGRIILDVRDMARSDSMRPLRVRFGDVAFDSTTRQLVRDGRAVHISLKAFELLKVLIERRPEAVSKEDLHTLLWPETYVSEANLPSLVNEIRTAIGDPAKKPHFIRTVHGFGYTFIGHAEDMSARSPAFARSRFVLVWERRQFPLHEGDNILGRDDDADVSLASSTLSRRHCVIRIFSQDVTIEDLQSKNGTYVRDERITTAVPLADGDRIRIGQFLLTLRASQKNVTTQSQTSAGAKRRS